MYIFYFAACMDDLIESHILVMCRLTVRTNREFYWKLFKFYLILTSSSPRLTSPLMVDGSWTVSLVSYAFVTSRGLMTITFYS